MESEEQIANIEDFLRKNPAAFELLKEKMKTGLKKSKKPPKMNFTETEMDQIMFAKGGGPISKKKNSNYKPVFMETKSSNDDEKMEEFFYSFSASKDKKQEEEQPSDMDVAETTESSHEKIDYGKEILKEYENSIKESLGPKANHYGQKYQDYFKKQKKIWAKQIKAKHSKSTSESTSESDDEENFKTKKAKTGPYKGNEKGDHTSHGSFDNIGTTEGEHKGSDTLLENAEFEATVNPYTLPTMEAGIVDPTAPKMGVELENENKSSVDDASLATQGEEGGAAHLPNTEIGGADEFDDQEDASNGEAGLASLTHAQSGELSHADSMESAVGLASPLFHLASEEEMKEGFDLQFFSNELSEATPTIQSSKKQVVDSFFFDRQAGSQLGYSFQPADKFVADYVIFERVDGNLKGCDILYLRTIDFTDHIFVDGSTTHSCIGLKDNLNYQRLILCNFTFAQESGKLLQIIYQTNPKSTIVLCSPVFPHVLWGALENSKLDQRCILFSGFTDEKEMHSNQNYKQGSPAEFDIKYLHG